MQSNIKFIVAFLVFSFSSVCNLFATTVQIQSNLLKVDGKPFIVKGVCYSPTPVGRSVSDYDWWTDQASYTADFSLIRNMGANTVRTFSKSLNIQAMSSALDSAYAHGLYVIMGFWVDQTSDLTKQTVRDGLLNDFKSMVTNFKDHPAVLMWSFGNEADNKGADFFTLLSSAATSAHAIEGSNFHPVTTAARDITQIGSAALKSDDTLLSSLDCWGINSYRGINFTDLFSSMTALTNKAFVMTEWGCDSYRSLISAPDETMQSDYLRSQWADIAVNVSTNPGKQCLGGTVFEWSDEWWKSNLGGGTNFTHDRLMDWPNPAYSDTAMNEEWWGIVGVTLGTNVRTLKTGYNTLKSLWNLSDDVALDNDSDDNSIDIINGEVKNYPNPLVLGQGSTKIKFLLNFNSVIKAAIFDLSGGKLCDLPNILPSSDGTCVADWNGKNSDGDFVQTGLYICRVEAATLTRNQIKYRKIAVVRQQ
jgi:hypothetical protein